MYNPDEECKAMVAALKRLCEQKGMSPHALAKEAGISTSTISYLMKGKTKPQVYQDIRCQSPLQKSYNYEKILNNIVIYDTIRKKMERGIQTQWLEEMIMKQKKKLERSG